MAEWTWLHVHFPLADIELMDKPIAAKDANVLVRTIRKVTDKDSGDERYEVRVAPHNVAPFRGGPWLHTFSRFDLEQPGEALAAFRERLATAVEEAKRAST